MEDKEDIKQAMVTILMLESQEITAMIMVAATECIITEISIMEFLIYTGLTLPWQSKKKEYLDNKLDHCQLLIYKVYGKSLKRPIWATVKVNN